MIDLNKQNSHTHMRLGCTKAKWANPMHLLIVPAGGAILPNQIKKVNYIL
jgi:hypothetical protein